MHATTTRRTLLAMLLAPVIGRMAAGTAAADALEPVWDFTGGQP